MMKVQILEILKENNIKLTNERRAIISVLQNHEKPLSPFEIADAIQKDLPKANLTTVYRNLELLENLGLVKRLSFNQNSFSYELVSDRPHHHHIICRSCGNVEDLHNISEKFIESLQDSTNFKIEDHNLEFFGVCAGCQKEEK